MGRVANNLREIRVSKGWSQAKLARHLHCTDVTVSRYETGQHGMDAETILKICEIFDCTSDYLLGRSKVSVSQLTDEEEQLLVAWRRSDSRARDMVAVALAPFRQEGIEETAM